MTELRKIDDQLYRAIYGIPRVGDAESIWNSIKTNNEILREAIQVEKDKFGERDLVKGLVVCRCMLIDYKNANQEIYQELVNTIYSNTDIARCVIDGASNGGYSYLLMTLWNHDLKLTDKQKQFAVSEAMNKIGTIRYEGQQQEFEEELDKMGITDEVTTILDIDGCINPVSVKTASIYMNFMFSSLSTTQAHGILPFDIRYEILRNPNWTIEEKRKLVYNFWTDAETYDELLEQWEWDIINDHANYKGEKLPQLDKIDMYEYTYQELLNFYGDKETTDRIWNEIKFCRTIRILRPQQYEEDLPFRKKLDK